MEPLLPALVEGGWRGQVGLSWGQKQWLQLVALLSVAPLVLPLPEAPLLAPPPPPPEAPPLLPEVPLLMAEAPLSLAEGVLPLLVSAALLPQVIPSLQ